MNFSDLAQALYPYCGKGKTQPEFVIILVDYFMEEPSNPEDIQKSEDGEYNPLIAMQPSTLNSYFNGKRKIKSANVSIILGRIDKQRFEEYINELSFDALTAICSELNKYGVTTTPHSVGCDCANLFEEALKRRVTGDKVKRNKTNRHIGIESNEELKNCKNELTQIHKILSKSDKFQQSLKQSAISIDFVDEMFSVSAQFHTSDDLANQAVQSIMQLCKKIADEFRHVKSKGADELYHGEVVFSYPISKFSPNLLLEYEKQFISYIKLLRKAEKRLMLTLDTLYASEGREQLTPDDSTPQPKNLVDLFEDAIDKYNIAVFVDSDYTATALSSDTVQAVDDFIDYMRHTLRSFRRKQDSTYRYCIDFINTIGNYSGYMGLRMFPNDDCEYFHWLPKVGFEIHAETLAFRRELNRLYGLISDGGTLSVYGYPTPEDSNITEEPDIPTMHKTDKRSKKQNPTLSKFLCYGTFATILNHCKKHNITQMALNSALLKSVNENFGLSNDTSFASSLFGCRKGLSTNIINCAEAVDRKAVANYFRKNIVPILDPNKRKLIVLSILDLIATDYGIESDTIVELVSNTSKELIINRRDFTFSDFLAGIFLYAVTITRNIDGKESVKGITAKYVDSFTALKDGLVLREYSNSTQIPKVLPMTELILNTAVEFSTKSAELTPGRIIAGNYEIIEKIGQGGSGAAYKAQNKRLGRIVALKELSILSNSPRFHEAIILKDLKHHFLPQLYDVVTDLGYDWMVMEFIDGLDFVSHIKNNGAPSKTNLIKYFRQLCSVVNYLHSLSPPIVHADIKPQNIILTPCDNICLVDFSVAQFIDENNPPIPIGITRGFTDPELYLYIQDFYKAIIIDRPLSIKSDIYSIGSTIYFLATGGDYRNSYDDWVFDDELSMFSIDSELSSIIHRCVNKKPEKRYDSLDEVIRDIKLLQTT